MLNLIVPGLLLVVAASFGKYIVALAVAVAIVAVAMCVVSFIKIKKPAPRVPSGHQSLDERIRMSTRLSPGATRAGRVKISTNGTHLDSSPASALIVDEPWISLILTGRKCWEMRSTALLKRGEIALIRKGSKTVVGLATIVGSRGPLDDTEVVANLAKHHVPLAEIGNWRHAWILTNVRALPSAVPYVHPKGAVKWVTLDESTRKRIAAAFE